MAGYRLRVIFIGHNSRDFLRQQRRYREAFAGPDMAVEVRSICGGPETVERELDEAEAAPWILEEARKAEQEGADAVMIDCAMDPCIPALRQAVSIPVIGAGMAAFAQALALGDRFSIIAPLKSLVPAYRRRMNEYCLQDRCASIRSISVPILDLLSEQAWESFINEGLLAVKEDGADVIVLGCTGLSPAFPFIRRNIPVPVIDPVAAAMGLARAIASERAIDISY